VLVTSNSWAYLLFGTIGSTLLAYLSFNSVWHAALFGFAYGMLYISIEAGLIKLHNKS
jgi:hypothetical protein